MDNRFEWFDNAQLGLFIHWGLYAIPAVGEWHLHKDAIPLAEYDKLANEFCPPPEFSPEEWVLLALRMGAKYAVLTTRHHDGFALWDSRNNSFNSVKTAAKRDFVREFVEACRKHGLRVGLYYSIMSWQYAETAAGNFRQNVWDRMVDDMHAQLKELMTGYGKIDLLWYDGCSAPGVDDGEALDRMWHTKELNAMVRRHQPDIIINNRSGQPEDFSTPEQCLTPPPPGRRWESCMTLNTSWGYTAADRNWKSSETLIRSLLHCCRFGGNLLLNIGPRPDGSVPAECTEALEKLGAYIRKYPAAVYGAERDAYTEAVHAAGVVTKNRGTYYLHAFHGHALDGVQSMCEVAPNVWRLELTPSVRPADMLGGRHDLAIQAGDAPVLGDNSGRYAPPDFAVLIEDSLLPYLENPRPAKTAPDGLYAKPYTADALLLKFPAGGAYDLDIGIVADREYGDFGEFRCRAAAPGFPETFQLHDFHSDGIPRRLPIPAGFTVYALRIRARWRPIPAREWQVAGFFPSGFTRTDKAPEMLAAMAQDMVALARSAEFVPVGEKNRLSDHGDLRVNFAYSAPRPGMGFGLAKKIIVSPNAQTVYACIGGDWWLDVYVNGRKVRAETHPERFYIPGGPEFISHKPATFRLELDAGKNELLVCNHGGTRANWFALYTNMAVDKA